MKGNVSGQWNKIFMEIFRSMLHGFLPSLVLILVRSERSLHCAQVSRQSYPWPLKLMMSQAVERRWILTGGYRLLRGEWVNLKNLQIRILMRGTIFQSVTQAAWKKKSELSKYESNLWPSGYLSKINALPASYRRLLGVKDTKLGSSDRHLTSLAAGKLSGVRWWQHRAGKGRRACYYVSGIWIPLPVPLACGSPSTELSDFHQSAWSGNKSKCKQIPTNTCHVISPNQHFTSTFVMWIFKFQRHSCKLSFLFLPRFQSALESLLVG